MVVVSLVLEAINIYINGIQLTQITRLAVKKACVFFGQETYKRDINSITNLPDIIGKSGAVAISGTIYGNDDGNQIYSKLYASNEEFIRFAKQYGQYWNNLNILAGDLVFHNAEQIRLEYELKQSYNYNKITPLNIGITYLDKNTLEKILKWNLSAILSNGNTNAIIDNDGSRIYIKYNGFNIYTQEAKITRIDYQEYNIIDQKETFERITNVDVDRLPITDRQDERAMVCVAGIHYTVPIRYDGITPFRKIIQYTQNTRARGINVGQSQINDISEGVLSGGGLTGNTSLPVSGKLIYYVLR